MKIIFFRNCPKELWALLVHCAPAWALFEYCAASAAFSHSRFCSFNKRNTAIPAVGLPGRD